MLSPRASARPRRPRNGSGKLILDGDLTETLKVYPDIERAEADESFDQLLTAPPLQPMPLVVLSADRPWGPLVPGFIATASWLPTPHLMSATSPTGRKRWRTRTSPRSSRLEARDEDLQGDAIHHDNPGLVTEFVRETIDAVRAGRTALVPGSVLRSQA